MSARILRARTCSIPPFCVTALITSAGLITRITGSASTAIITASAIVIGSAHNAYLLLLVSFLLSLQARILFFSAILVIVIVIALETSVLLLLLPLHVFLLKHRILAVIVTAVLATAVLPVSTHFF